MNPKQKYKNQLAAIKATLQRHDPLNYLILYAGERFEEQLYSYEAATILEKFRDSSNNSDIEAFIISCSKSENKTNAETIKNSASDIGRVINGF